MELDWKSISFEGGSEQDLAEQFVEHLKQYNLQFHGKSSGLYMMTNDAGSQSSITLWQNALQHSPRFANPAIFPYTLANAVAAVIAKTFIIEGPNYTIVDGDVNKQQLLNLYLADQSVLELQSSLFVVWEFICHEPLEVKVEYAFLSQ